MRLDPPPPPDKVTLKLKDASFWEALDEIGAAVGFRDDTQRQARQVVLVPGTRAAGPTCYDGPFRIQLESLTATRDFTAMSRVLVARLLVHHVLQCTGGLRILTRPQQLLSQSIAKPQVVGPPLGRLLQQPNKLLCVAALPVDGGQRLVEGNVVRAFLNDRKEKLLDLLS